MAFYLAERHVPGVTPAQWTGMRQALSAACEQYRERGKTVRYVRSTFVASEARCLCLFEAADARLVRDVNEAAGVPFTRIVEAVELSPP